MNQIRTIALVGVAVAAGAAQAGTLPVGLYELHNHPDGNATPPPYGLRLDELYNATSGHDIFTFDFDAALSSVTLNYTGSTIVIEGDAFGGRDIGGGYALEATTGMYSFRFVYDVGVGIAGGDDDVIVVANMANTGWISTPTGDTIDLLDKSNGSYSFRLGDEDNDAGHRGFSGISGWGWLNHGGLPHVDASDFLFTVGDLVPAPGSVALVGLAGLMSGRRRR